MSSNKTLSITKSGNTFEDENKAENIKFILYKSINDIDIKECTVYLNFINADGRGKPVNLTKYISDYSDEYYVAEIPMSRVLTSAPGVIKLWLEITSLSSDMIARTGKVTCVIQDHDDIVCYIPEDDMPVLYEILKKVNDSYALIDEVNRKLEDLKSELSSGSILMINKTN